MIFEMCTFLMIVICVVVGDRRLLRFLRGQQHRIDEATKMYGNFLKWRKANNVDEVRQDIIYGGKDTPFKFPSGAKIIALAPQIIISALALDRKDQLLALEQYGFSPKEIMQNVTIEEYLKFLTYVLEYRTLVMEQVSHEREVAYCQKYPNEADRVDGYGVLVMDFTIRDLKGLCLFLDSLICYLVCRCGSRSSWFGWSCFGKGCSGSGHP